MRPGCPHADIRWCPLYHAAHEAWGLGCDDGKIGNGGCAAARGMDYAKTVWKIRVLHPGYVEQIEWREQAEAIQQQRDRNVRLNGIH